MKAMVLAIAVWVIGAGQVSAEVFSVIVTGEVEFNQIGSGQLGLVNGGDSVVMSFDVDSDNFVDSAVFPTRGYEIIEDSFSLMMGDVTLGLQDPFPATETPFFVIRDNDPAVDGFLLASSPDVGFPNGVPIDQAGAFGQFRMVYATTYDTDPLPSLDIADAVGTYDFDGLTVFSMRIADGPVDSAMGMIFSEMMITPEPTSLVGLLVMVGLMGGRR